MTSISALSAANRTTPAFGNTVVAQAPVKEAIQPKNDSVEITKQNTA